MRDSEEDPLALEPRELVSAYLGGSIDAEELEARLSAIFVSQTLPELNWSSQHRAIGKSSAAGGGPSGNGVLPRVAVVRRPSP
jgi:hypothetical protein